MLRRRRCRALTTFAPSSSATSPATDHLVVALRAAGAAERSHAAVRQRRHGAVQEHLHRRRDPAGARAPRRRRSASAPAASTTTSTTSATPAATRPSSRCWGISPSATTSRKARSSSPGRFVTRDLGLPPDRLIVSIHPQDEDAARCGRRSPASRDDRIVRLEENFWSMGDTGPCGTNTEIFYDHGDATSPAARPAARTRTATASSRSGTWSSCSGSSSPTARAATCPSRRSTPAWASSAPPPCCRASTRNYDIDLFRALIAASEAATGVAGDAARRQLSHQVIADHLRSTSFLIADGVGPSNEGRGYVLRRIMRRAMRHAHLLGAEEPLMHRLVPTLVARDGRRLSGAAPRRAGDRRDPAPGGGALPRAPSAAAWPCSTRRPRA